MDNLLNKQHWTLCPVLASTDNQFGGMQSITLLLLAGLAAAFYVPKDDATLGSATTVYESEVHKVAPNIVAEAEVRKQGFFACPSGGGSSCDRGCDASCDRGCTTSCDGKYYYTKCDQGCTWSCDEECNKGCNEDCDADHKIDLGNIKLECPITLHDSSDSRVQVPPTSLAASPTCCYILLYARRVLRARYSLPCGHAQAVHMYSWRMTD